MRRLHLPEIEDQGWCPAWIRDAMTGYLQAVIERARPYDVAIPRLVELLDSTGSDEVVDLASGGGGPWRGLSAELRKSRSSARVTLTDLHPNRSTIAGFQAQDGIEYLSEPISALDPPAQRGGVRTMFTALHHFDAREVRSIFLAAQRDRVGFAAFEATQRSVRGVLLTLVIPLLVLVLMPSVRPRRALALVLTYLPPLLPLLIWWDGLASTLRTHSPDELRALVTEIREPGYSWEVDEVRVRGAPIPVLQVIGRPDPISGPEQGRDRVPGSGR